MSAVKAAGGKSVEGKKLLDQMTTLTDELKRRTDKLEKALAHEGTRVATTAREALSGRGDSGDGRAARDRRRARAQMPHEAWPLATYREMLFIK